VRLDCVLGVRLAGDAHALAQNAGNGVIAPSAPEEALMDVAVD
jgi:hypothetical protein